MSSPWLRVDEAVEYFRFKNRQAVYDFLQRHPHAQGVRKIGNRILIHRDEFSAAPPRRYDLPPMRRPA